MVKRPDDMQAFEFAVVSGLRAAQLSRGCTPRVERSPKLAVTAQHEVAEHKVRAVPATLPLAPAGTLPAAAGAASPETVLEPA
jgi:hypothetical protein